MRRRDGATSGQRFEGREAEAEQRREWRVLQYSIELYRFELRSNGARRLSVSEVRDR